MWLESKTKTQNKEIYGDKTIKYKNTKHRHTFMMIRNTKYTTKYQNTYGDKTRVDCWKVGREWREVTIPLLALLENRQQSLEEILFGNTTKVLDNSV